MRSKGIVVFVCLVFLVAAGFVSAQTVQLPRTGQIKCHDTAGSEINCAGTGQDGEYQMGVPWPEPRFMIQSDCATDNLTGLMWALSPDITLLGWDHNIDYANSLTLCGHSDWRLPNINELRSLSHAGEPLPGLWLSNQGFTALNSFGSSTTFSGDMNYQWAINFYQGGAALDAKGSNWGVPVGLPVRGSSSLPAQLWKSGQTQSYRTGDDGHYQAGVSWPDPRFVTLGDCVVDNLTGLMWLRNANLPTGLLNWGEPTGLTSWQEALDFANTLNSCGYSDWRLPNREELMSLIDFSQNGPALPQGNPFVNVAPDSYWTSTTKAGNTDYAWIVNMGAGSLQAAAGNVGLKALQSGHVWPVRTTGSLAIAALLVQRSGSGSGTVTSSSFGINCGSDCSESYNVGSSVTLNAVPNEGSSFTGWSGGGCSGTGECVIIMDADVTVTATFKTGRGKILLVNDDWVLSDTGFAAPNTPGTFATNVAAWFTGGRSGRFHAYSDHFGLTGSSLASAMSSAGHTWAKGTAGFTFNLPTLQQYDGIFLLVALADNNVLIDYVESGGNVYLAYCGVGSVDEQYTTFVNHFGLGLGTIYNGVTGNVAINSSHPIFAGVHSLYNVNGSDIVDLAPADARQLVLVSQNGHGLYAVYDEGGFTQSDLAGTWYLQVYEDNVSVNAPYWASGTLILDNAGNVTGGTAVNDSGLVRTFTGGSFIIDSTGQVSGTLAASGGITGTLHGKMDPGKNILTLVDTNNSGYRGLFVMAKGGGAFTQSDLSGTWYFQVYGDMLSANSPGWITGTMIVNTTGNITGGTEVNSSGVVRTLTGGSLTIDSLGQVNGTLTLSSGTIERFPHGKLDAGKNILVMVNSDPDFRGLFMAEKGGGGFSQSDLSGTWSLQVVFDTLSANNPLCMTGSMIINTAGSITGGTVVGSSGGVKPITGGSLTIDSLGQVNGDMTLSGNDIESFPHGKLDAGKNILVMANSCQNCSGGSGLLIAIKNNMLSQGDLNGDGNVDLVDAIIAMQVLTGMPLTQMLHKEADVNGDGKIGMQETIYILQKVAGLQ